MMANILTKCSVLSYFGPEQKKKSDIDANEGEI